MKAKDVHILYGTEGLNIQGLSPCIWSRDFKILRSVNIYLNQATLISS